MTITISDLLRPEILIAIGFYLALCIVCTWALFRATDPRDRDDERFRRK